MLDDIIDRPSKEYKGYEQILIPVIKDGKLVYDFPSLEKTREYTRRQFLSLPDKYKRLDDFEEFPVKIGKDIMDAKDRIIKENVSS